MFTARNCFLPICKREAEDGSVRDEKNAQMPSSSPSRFVARRRWMLLLLLCLLKHLGSSQAQTPTTDQINCVNPLATGTPLCQNSAVPSPAGNTQSLQEAQGARTAVPPVYQDNAGAATVPPNTSPRENLFPPDPMTDFQRLVRSSTGEDLPIFGRDLFERAPSTFAPANQVPVTSDYVVGPGDEILLRLWGPDTLNSQLTVDPAGSIYIPRVGAVRVAGLRYDELQKEISIEVSRVFRNYTIAVTLGRLRSIQVYIVGEARRPGAYTVSALSTALNVLFVSGGPNVQGSLRRIQVRREGQAVPLEFDVYDLVLRGDKSKDVRLQQGDTIFIPPAGPQVALGGSVRHPAIYELRGETTLGDLLEMAGGPTSTAASTQISVERIDPSAGRKALTIAADNQGRQMPLRDGDVLFVNHISPGYQQSVTIRGNLANPGRFTWHEGMRLSEIIPDKRSLLTTNYWRERNRLGIPEPLFEPSSENRPTQSDTTPATSKSLALQSSQLPITSVTTQSDVPVETTDAQADPTHRVQIPVPEIDWSYAVIERLDARTLKSTLLSFNLGKLVLDHDPSQNLEVLPRDIITILSQADIPVSLDEQTKFVRLEGEFAGAGVYSVGPGETLRDLVRRAGGVTPRAYLYGSSFLRESARVFQQQRMNEYITTLSNDMERAAAMRAASSVSGALDQSALSAQRALVAQLRQVRATGRVVLEFKPASAGPEVVPDIPLENGDVFRIPSRPNTVSVIGAVYGQNIFLYNSNRRVQDYIALAGKPNRIADRKHAFIIRADGSIYSHDRAQGVFANMFDTASINPGDAIVVPEKLIKPSAIRQLLEYSQIFSSIGFAAAAISVIR